MLYVFVNLLKTADPGSFTVCIVDKTLFLTDESWSFFSHNWVVGSHKVCVHSRKRMFHNMFCISGTSVIKELMAKSLASSVPMSKGPGASCLTHSYWLYPTILFQL